MKPSLNINTMFLAMVLPLPLASCASLDLDRDYHRRLSEDYRIRADRQESRAQYKEAEASIRVAVEHARALGKKTMMLACALEESGRLKIRQKQFPEAQVAYSKSTDVYKSVSERSDLEPGVRKLALKKAAYTQTVLAELYLRKKEYKAAEQALSSALKTYKSILKSANDLSCKQEEINCLTRLAKVLELEGEQERAAIARSRALEYSQQLNTGWLSIRRQALSDQKSGNYEEAELALKSALDRARKSGVRDFSFFQTLNDLIQLHERTGNFAGAASYQEERLKEFRSILQASDPKLVEIISQTAFMDARANEGKRARLLTDELFALNEASARTADWNSLLDTLLKISEESARNEQMDDCKHYINLAASIRKKYKLEADLETYWKLCRLKTSILITKRNYQEALDLLKQAFAYFGQKKQLPQSGDFNWDLIRFVQKLGGQEEFEYGARIALLGVEQGRKDLPSHATLERVLGQTLTQTRDFDDAEYHLKQALSASKKAVPMNNSELGFCYFDLATNHIQKAEIEKALEMVEAAKAFFEIVRDKNGLGFVYNREARLRLILAGESPEKKKSVEKYFRQDLDFSREAFGDSSLNVALVLNSYANYLSSCKRYTEAAKLYERSLSIMDRILRLHAEDRRLQDLLAGYRSCLEIMGNSRQAKILEKRIILKAKEES